MSDKEMVQRAEGAVERVLPDVPIWKGVKFAGSVIDESTVCVDRTWPRRGGIDGKGGSAGYVLVTFPKETLGDRKTACVPTCLVRRRQRQRLR